MRPAKEFRAAREAFRRDQQSWTFFDPLLIFAMRYQKLIARLNYAHITQEPYKGSANLLSNSGFNCLTFSVLMVHIYTVKYDEKVVQPAYSAVTDKVARDSK